MLDRIALGAPIDALWLRLSRRAGDPSQAFGYVEGGHIFVMFEHASTFDDSSFDLGPALATFEQGLQFDD